MKLDFEVPVFDVTSRMRALHKSRDRHAAGTVATSACASGTTPLVSKTTNPAVGPLRAGETEARVASTAHGVSCWTRVPVGVIRKMAVCTVPLIGRVRTNTRYLPSGAYR